MPTLHAQIKVNAPPEKLFDYLADFSKHGEWAGHPLTVATAGAEGVKAGATLTSTAKMMGEHHANLTVVEATRPSLLVFEAADDTGKYRHTISIQPDGEGSLLTKTVTMIGGDIATRVLGAVWMLIVTSRLIKQDVRRIKGRAEAA